MKTPIKKSKRALALCAVFIILFIGTVVLMFLAQRQLFIESNKENLQILANEKAVQINNFLESQKEKQTTIAVMNVFKEVVLYSNDTTKISIAKDRINELKSIIPGIAIFTDRGIIILAESAPAGTDYSTHPYFVSKDKNILFTRYYDLYQKKDFYVIIGPIYDLTEKDKVIGSIAFQLELNKISSLIKETSDAKENDEVYLIEETGLLLSRSKFIGESNKNGILIQEVKSDGAIECLEHVKKFGKNESVEGHAEDVIQYTNYMGNEVFGAHAYVPSIMGCVIAEKSVDDILNISFEDYIVSAFHFKVFGE